MDTKRGYFAITLLLIAFLSSRNAFAGGGFIELNILNEGVEKGDGVKIDVYSYGQEEGKEEKVGTPNQGYSVKVINPIENQECTPEVSYTDTDGHASFTCFSDSYGSASISLYYVINGTGEHIELPNHKGTITFNRNFDLVEDLVEASEENSGEKPTEGAIDVIANINKQKNTDVEELAEELEDVKAATSHQQEQQEFLENNVINLTMELNDQKEDISVLQKIVDSILSFLGNIFN